MQMKFKMAFLILFVQSQWTNDHIHTSHLSWTASRQCEAQTGHCKRALPTWTNFSPHPKSGNQ